MAYISLSDEARTLSILPSDVDSYRNRYTTTEEKIDGSNIRITFVSPIISVYERFRFYILQHSQKKKVSLRNKYRPDYVSYKEYGTTNWWTLLLYINDIPSIEEFVKDEILVPTIDCIALIEDAIGESTVNEYNQDEFNGDLYPLLYSHSKDNFNVNDTIEELITIKKDTQDLDEDRFKREQFILDIPTLRLRYIELKHEPIENSINLVIKGKPNYTYGKHYKYVLNGDSPRITWDPNIVTGSGLIFRLKEKDIIEVKYVSKE